MENSELGNIDKRRHIRHSIGMPVEIDAKGEKKLLASNDISEGGVSFVSNRQLSPGDAVKILVPVKNKFYKIKGTVTYCDENYRSWYFLTGVRFEDVPMEFRKNLSDEFTQIAQHQEKLQVERDSDVSEAEAAADRIAHLRQTHPSFIKRLLGV